MATASMVLGIIAVVFVLFCPPIGLVLALVGLPLAIISFAKQKSGSAVADSKGMALAGVILNIVAFVFLFVVVLGLVVLDSML